MNQTISFPSHHGYKDIIGAKAPPLRSLNTLDSPRAHFEEDQYFNGDAIHSPPPLTIGSSTSAPSSVAPCDTDGYSTQQCLCHSQSDLESVQLQGSDKGSPKTSQNRPLQLRNGKPTFPEPRLHESNDRSDVSGHSRDIAMATRRCGYESTFHQQASEQPDNTYHPGPQASASDNQLLVVSRNFQYPQTALYDPDCEMSGLSENDDDSEDDSSSDEGSWSGENDNLEVEQIVLGALGGDLSLAAYLIPILYRSIHIDRTTTVTQKVAPWRNDLTGCAAGAGTDRESPVNIPNDESDHPRKKRRRYSDKQNRGVDEHEEGEGDDGDGNDDPHDLENSPETNGGGPILRLACPFHKSNPLKYCTQHGVSENPRKLDYRSCAGPGYTSIQRLKEHLKRKHYPVQCDRCYKTFPGQDRSACVLALESHRQLAASCDRGDSSLKEGISDAQWAKLDKKKNPRKTQATSRIERYWEIWDVLFPDVPRPRTPWYGDQLPNTPHKPFAQDSQRFSEFYSIYLKHQVTNQRICFREGEEEEMIARLSNIAQGAFSYYAGLHGLPSTTNSSSSRSRAQTSLLSGSYQHVRTIGRNSSSASRSTAAHSQAYSMDAIASPQADPVLVDSRSQRHDMGPPFMPVQGMVPSNYSPSSIGHSSQAQYPMHTAFSELQTGSHYPGDSFAGGNLNPTSGAGWCQSSYDPATTYNSSPTPNMRTNDYNIPTMPEILMDTTDSEQHDISGMREWDGIPSQRRINYGNS